MRRFSTALLLAAVATGCASLSQFGALLQPPRFDEAPGQPAELRLLSPATALPLGGAGVRLWTRVRNPNPFGFTLGTLRGTLYLEDASAATIDLPLGLPLAANGETTFPIDVTVSFADLPRLVEPIRRATRNEPVGYRLEGTIGVEAGRFGTPTFGPLTMLRGEIGGSAVPRF